MPLDANSSQIEDEIQNAYLLAKKGMQEEAIAAYQGLRALCPKEPRVLSTLGALLFQRGELVNAKKLLEESLRIEPNQAKSLLNLAAILFNLGELDNALQTINRSLELGDPIAATWSNRALIFNAQGRYDEALSDLDKALELDPTNIEALYHKGMVLQRIGQIAQAAACYQHILALAPDHGNARYNLAILQTNGGALEQALANLTYLISAQPTFVEAFILRGQTRFALGRLDEALEDTENALGYAPNHVGALFQKGRILLERGDAAGALELFDNVRGIAPGHTYNLLALGVARFTLKDYPRAIETFDAVINLAPTFPEAFNNKGLVLQELKQHDAAIENYERALALRPDHPDALYNKANALREQGAFEEALALYDRLLAIVPDHLGGWMNKGATLDKLKRHGEALDAYNRVIYLQPGNAEAYANASTALLMLKKQETALAYATKALKIDPKNVNAFHIRALILMRLGMLDHAKIDAEEALNLEPRHAMANYVMGNVYDELKQLPEALAHFEIAQAENGDIEFLHGRTAHLRMEISDWRFFQDTIDRILALIDQKKPVCQPFELHSKIDAPEYHKKCAEIFYDTSFRAKTAVPLPHHAPNPRIHIAYFSSDIANSHPVSNLMAGVFEAHDPNQFEITLFLLDNHSGETRNRITRACERTINAEFMTDDEVVALAHDLKIDIAIDLNGFTSKNRTGLFARRAAPLQLHYLGFLGTMSSDCYDYIVGDPVIAPFAHQHHFSEKIIHLPCYQANDDKLTVPATTQTRDDFGLPRDAFVFCSFNANYKITPAMFAAWMRILHLVPDSVLWLYCKRENAIANLRDAAAAHGIPDERLVFANGVPYLEHLARQRLADLFLDTTPYNAGATASNALYCGLPLVTYAGKAFCSRYGASLLTALGLPELITYSIEDYIALCARIATDGNYHAQIREKLAKNLQTQPLFNTRDFTANLEGAYRAIQARHQQGLRPDHIAVDDVLRHR